MAVVLTNNAVSRLASSLATGATALSVTAGEGSKFPSPAAGDWFPLTLIKSNGSLEIARCTARSGDVLTVVRAQEGTAAQAFAVGDRAELRLTAAAINSFVPIGSGSLELFAALPLIDFHYGNSAADFTSRIIADADKRLSILNGAVKSAHFDESGGTIFGDLGVTGQIVTNGSSVLVRAGAGGAYSIYDANGGISRFNAVGGVITSGVIFHTGNFNPADKLDKSSVSTFINTLLPAADAPAARSTLGVIDGPGVRQTWQDVTASRAVATTYTNSTGKPISVSLNVATNATSTSATFTVDSVIVGHWFSDGGRIGPAEFIIPAGSTYRLALTAGAIGITKWAELR